MTTRRPHILIVDDDREIRALLTRFLTEQDFRVGTATDGPSMLTALKAHRFDAIVLDVMLPGEDGMSLCRRLRQELAIPIIMLTARSEEADRIVGLELGADDYIVKPFSPRELVARLRAVLRRAATSINSDHARPQFYGFAGWTLDIGKRLLRSADDSIVALTSGEFDLLLAFVEHPGQILSREQLLDFTRGRSPTLFDRSIDVQVSRLRRKIERDPNMPDMIKTVRSGGYLFATEVKELSAA